MTNTLRPHEERPHEVYTLRDAAGVVLYVGVSSNVTARVRQHRAQKPWWPDVDLSKCTVTQAMPWADALTVEEHYIRTLAPLHNKRRANGSLYVRLGVRDEAAADREASRQRTAERQKRRTA